MSSLKIYLDSREKEDRLLYAKQLYKNYKPVITTLPVADYLFSKKEESVAFEYKTVPDFCSSFENSSVFNQCYNMSQEYPHNYLIIVGDVDKELVNLYYKRPNLRNRYKNPYTFKKNYQTQFNGAIMRCRVASNVIFAKNREEAFDIMLKQSEKCLSEKTYYGSPRQIKKLGKDNQALRYLTFFDGVGKKTAEKIIKENNIKGLKGLLNLTYDDLIKIPRIDDDLATDILVRINEE